MSEPLPLAALSPPPQRLPHPPAPGAAAEAPRRWRSSELLRGSAEIEIEHGAAVYRLRLTAQGKLILTK